MRRILHLSDVHFGPPHRAELSESVLTLVRERQPDLVVLSGDLTQRAKARQFQEARRFVDRLGVPALTVPGNHDVPMYRWAFLARVFAPFAAYRRHFSAELEPIFEDDELLVVGINTAFNWTIRDGRIKPEQLRRACARLEAAPAEKFKIVVAHHNLIQPPAFGGYKAIPNAGKIVPALAKAGARLILSGHTHVTLRAESHDWFPGDQPSMTLLHSGTTTSDRYRKHGPKENTCFWVEVTEGEAKPSLLLWAGKWVEEAHP